MRGHPHSDYNRDRGKFWRSSSCSLEHVRNYWRNLEKWYNWTYLQGRSRETDIKNRLVDPMGEREDGTNFEIRIDIRRRQWHPIPVLLPGKSHGWRSLVGYSPWGLEESDTNERLHFHFSLSFTGEGNGNPLKCSCLENPRDGGAWWAAVYGVTQSRTRLKWLSSSSSRIDIYTLSGIKQIAHGKLL